MEQLTNRSDKDTKKRRFNIGIILIIIGLLGMLASALVEQPEPPQPASRVYGEFVESVM